MRLLKFLFIFFLIITSGHIFSQGVAINSSNAASDASAILDVSSSSKGVLLPRVTESEKLAIAAPATGLLVYQTDNAVGFWYYSGTSWTPVAGGGPSGNNPGDIQYWTGSEWSIVPVGLPGQSMILSASGLPVWVGPTYPSLTTSSLSSTGATVAVSGGSISSDGGSAVTARGICWSTSPNPTIDDNFSSNGSGTGAYTSTMSGLSMNTQYYARAYATNGVGTAYGNQITFTTQASPVIGIGETYAGGIIFYIDGSGLHGLVAAPYDQSSSAQWGCVGSYFGGTSTAFGTGQANTTQIVNNCGTAGIAARICDDLVLSGYSDWFLPSEDELYLAYQNLHLNEIGGFTNNYYWTSSEVHLYSSWFVYFLNGYQDWNSKDTNFPVRAVRAF